MKKTKEHLNVQERPVTSNSEKGKATDTFLRGGRGNCTLKPTEEEKMSAELSDSQTYSLSLEHKERSKITQNTSQTDIMEPKYNEPPFTKWPEEVTAKLRAASPDKSQFKTPSAEKLQELIDNDEWMKTKRYTQKTIDIVEIQTHTRSLHNRVVLEYVSKYYSTARNNQAWPGGAAARETAARTTTGRFKRKPKSYTPRQRKKSGAFAKAKASEQLNEMPVEPKCSVRPLEHGEKIADSIYKFVNENCGKTYCNRYTS